LFISFRSLAHQHSTPILTPNISRRETIFGERRRLLILASRRVRSMLRDRYFRLLSVLSQGQSTRWTFQLTPHILFLLSKCSSKILPRQSTKNARRRRKYHVDDKFLLSFNRLFGWGLDVGLNLKSLLVPPWTRRNVGSHCSLIIRSLRRYPSFHTSRRIASHLRQASFRSGRHIIRLDLTQASTGSRIKAVSSFQTHRWPILRQSPESKSHKPTLSISRFF
jgi:hypothetical protein